VSAAVENKIAESMQEERTTVKKEKLNEKKVV
jgi:hypothetical protein